MQKLEQLLKTTYHFDVSYSYSMMFVYVDFEIKAERQDIVEDIVDYVKANLPVGTEITKELSGYLINGVGTKLYVASLSFTVYTEDFESVKKLFATLE